uniref:NADH dehydrogenase subunit 6 n=1 Tax=Metathelazia capsulata TaxID=2964486 RepID=UPI002E77741A|nr:NADH dehydrogenase subunit 6 [Metathelazia capsulata]WPS93543.1 NADH dehydrogenase subunit 6 [Metathelazia capsulata]
MYFMMYFFIFFSIFFCCLCFLEKEVMMSSLYLTLAVLSFCPLISLGFHSWYSYFIVLVFLSGVLSLLVYLCSIMDFNYSFSFFYYNFFFSFFWSFFYFSFLSYDYYLVFDTDFYVIFMDFNYYYMFWIVFVLSLFLNFVSYFLSMKGCLRSF